MTIHSSSPNLNLVPGAGLHSPHTASSGAHYATGAPGEVSCLEQLLTIDVEEAVVPVVAVHLGIHTIGYSPCSRHRHSEDP